MVWTVRRNPLDFPIGRRPGFDPSHLVVRSAINKKIDHSFIATANECFIDLLTGKAGTKTGAQAGGIANGLGRYVGPYNGNYTTFSSYTDAASNDPRTFAAILSVPSPDAGHAYVCSTSSTGGNGQQIDVHPSGFITFNDWSTNISSAIGFFGGAPMFYAVSNAAGLGCNAIGVNLITGQVATSFGNSFTGTSTNDGTFTIMRGPGAGSSTLKFATLMSSRSAVSPQDLLAWAADPWSFWYPRVPMPYYRAPTLYKLRPDGDLAIGNWTRG